MNIGAGPRYAGLDRRLRRGVEQRQLVGLITQRSQVRVLPPLPENFRKEPPGEIHGGSWFSFNVMLAPDNATSKFTCHRDKVHS